ncbi:hypothetical protein BXZ70DRAFT_86173 [Cristinia sonorae]|uniref:F-box domain-containing protein n=1 Tax=Cristinia sonorae TaxID=1940300 RepID=A0A8K0UQ72_9AGAR|nr:hypothetical protein BXZ70DRAFT_86173 [Cristinia sonorae]
MDFFADMGELEDAFVGDTEGKMKDPSPLVTLPPELIVDIFLFTFSSDWSKETAYSLDPKQPNYGEDFSRARRIWRSLQNYMLTCQYWRDVALQAPILWRNVHFGRGIAQKVTETMLSRSGETPIRLTAAFKKDTVANMTMLLPHLARVTHLHLRIADFPAEEGVKEDIPMLQHLVVSCRSGMARKPHTSLPLLSKTSLLPDLILLHAYMVSLHHIQPFLRSTIRHLYVTGLDCSIKDLMFALEALPVLERLAIEALHTPEEDDALQTAELPHVNFPKLAACYISSDVIPIFSHIAFPDQVITSHEFSLKLWRCSDQEVLEVVKLLLERLSSIDDEVMAEMLERDSLEIQLDWTGDNRTSDLDIDILTPRGDYKRSLLSCYSDDELHIKDILDEMKISASPFFKSHVRHLDITSHKCHDSTYSELLADLTGLQSLKLNRTPGIVAHLVSAHQESPEPTSPMSTLKRLTLVEAKFRQHPPDDPEYEPDEDELIWALRDMLKARKADGHPLQSLRVFKGVHFGEADVRMLQEYVTEEVVWDGRAMSVDLEHHLRGLGL